jgi:hypothetical protein
VGIHRQYMVIYTMDSNVLALYCRWHITFPSTYMYICNTWTYTKCTRSHTLCTSNVDIMLWRRQSHIFQVFIHIFTPHRHIHYAQGHTYEWIYMIWKVNICRIILRGYNILTIYNKEITVTLCTSCGVIIPIMIITRYMMSYKTSQ